MASFLTAANGRFRPWATTRMNRWCVSPSISVQRCRSAGLIGLNIEPESFHSPVVIVSTSTPTFLRVSPTWNIWSLTPIEPVRVVGSAKILSAGAAT